MIIPIQLSCKTVVGKALGNVESVVGMKMMRPVKLEDPLCGPVTRGFFARLSYGDVALHTGHAHTEASLKS